MADRNARNFEQKTNIGTIERCKKKKKKRKTNDETFTTNQWLNANVSHTRCTTRDALNFLSNKSCLVPPVVIVSSSSST